MRVLVTGGAGYMGSTLVPMLLQQGHQVRVVDSLRYGGESLIGCVPNPDFQFIPVDVRCLDSVIPALEGMDAVVHLAAIVGDPACARHPEMARQVNLDATVQLFRAVESHGVSRFIFSSTCSNYGKMGDPSMYLTEESPLQPISVYAETKVDAEAAVLDASPNSYCAPTVLRFATLFGLSPRLRFDLTVNEFTMKLLTTRELVLYGEQFWRPYVHVHDAARAIVSVLNTAPAKVSSQVFNVGDSKQNYQKGQLVDAIQSKIGGCLQIQHVHKEEDPRDYRVSFDKIARKLNFQITRTVDHGIEEIIDAIRSGIIADPDNPRYTNLRDEDD